MGKEKYVYNPKTLQFEKHKITPKQRFYKLITGMCLVLAVSTVMVLLYSEFWPTPREKAQAMEIDQLEFHLGTMSTKINSLSKNLNKLHQKDNTVHRVIFNMAEIDDNVWDGGTGGSEEYDYLSIGKSSKKIKESMAKLDKLDRQFDLQSRSLDSLYNLAIKREQRIASIPSIKPVREDKLRKEVKHLSGFGIRLHPVHKVQKFHKGIDFTAPSGTAIQSTGAGIVVGVNDAGRGYGNNVVIDHGFGFKTMYAHMSKVDVKEGAKVAKGQKIGSVGSTGTSTAPHLHYEVWINGKAVNPIDYVLDGLSPAEYQEVVQKASIKNQSWD